MPKPMSAMVLISMLSIMKELPLNHKKTTQMAQTLRSSQVKAQGQGVLQELLPKIAESANHPLQNKKNWQPLLHMTQISPPFPPTSVPKPRPNKHQTKLLAPSRALRLARTAS